MSTKRVVCSGFAAAVFSLAVMATAPARADEVGTLICHSAESSAYIIISSRSYDCSFKPVAGATQYYRATINRFGAQVGISSNVTLAWVVTAVSTHVGAGALAGSYGGASAGAAVGVGAGANALVGGPGNAFLLQPLSGEGMEGLNAVATVTGLSLETVRPHHKRARHRRRG